MHIQICKNYGKPTIKPRIGIGDQDLTFVVWRRRFIIWQAPLQGKLYAWVSRRRAAKMDAHYAKCLRNGEIV